MKKYKNFLISLIIILTIPIILKTVKKSHQIEYKRNDYNIKEIYNYKNKKHIYDIIIKDKKQEYSFRVELNVNKRKKIIKKINTYKQGNITCISPIYIKNKDKELFCIEDEKQVSNYYLKDNKNYNKILEKLNIKVKDEKEKTNTYNKIIIYKNNFPENYKLIIWNYKGIFIIDKNSEKNVKFLDKDLYDNIMSTVTKRYYVLFDNTNLSGIKKIYYYDIEKDKYKTFKLEKNISKKSYINGTYKDVVYVTDIESKKQYAINIKKEKIEEVGNKNLGYIKYIDGKKEIIQKKEFFETYQYFENERIIDENVLSSKELVYQDNFYYFKEDNIMYSKMKESTNKLLFKMDNIKEWNIYNNDLTFTVDDSIYIYNEKIGLKKLITYNELNYNYSGIYKIWKR